MLPTQYIPILTLSRGETIESIHYGAFAIVDSKGSLIAAHSSPKITTFLRSSSKPFQALPLVESGGARHWRFIPKEIAITCGSHSGTDDHARTLAGMQAKFGIDQNILQCGIHPPIDSDTAKNLLLQGQEPTQNRQNCSGKHTGMLAYAKANNLSLDDYLDQQHPLQQRIIQTVCEMCDLDPEEIQLGIDGCSAPNFAMPLENAALGFARLVDPWNLPSKRAEACNQIIDAMTSHPLMVAGPGQFDTRLMKSACGKIVSKGGAEGFQAIGIKPGVLGPNSPGVGISIKISDGDPRGRARAAVALQILTQLGALNSSEAQSLDDLGPSFQIRNWRQILVGKASPTFHL